MRCWQLSRATLRTHNKKTKYDSAGQGLLRMCSRRHVHYPLQVVPVTKKKIQFVETANNRPTCKEISVCLRPVNVYGKLSNCGTIIIPLIRDLNQIK